jgi:hypothetical protein
VRSLQRRARRRSIAFAKASPQARIAGLRRFGAVARASGNGHAVTEHDSKHIARQWDREIEDEIRREAARDAAAGPWRAVAWGALWVFWLGLLLALIAHTRALG